MTPTELAKAASISVPYASQILKGDRPWSLALALKAYDSSGERFGPLADLTPREIEKTARKMASAA